MPLNNFTITRQRTDEIVNLLQAIWISTSLQCVSSTLCTLRNIYSPNVKVSRLLLLAGASPNFKTEYMGNAPVLCMYAHEGSVEMVSLLLEFGADLELTNSQGCTALALAAARGHCDVVRRYIRKLFELLVYKLTHYLPLFNP